MGDLLKEAIADAKAVRETALQNAKMALEEAFTPQLKSMLSAKLREDDDEFEDDELGGEEDEFGGEEPDLGGEPEFGGEDVPVPEEEPEETMYAQDEVPGDEFGGEEEVPEDEFGEEEPEMEGVIEINGVKYAPVVSEDEVYESEEPVEESEEDNLDLESVIKELEDEIEEGAEIAGDGHEKNVEGDEDPKHVGGHIGENTEFEIDESLFEGEDDEDEEEIEEQSKSSNIGSADNALDAASSSDEEDPGGAGYDKSGKIGESRLRTELKEYKEAVSFLKDKLHEVNILNAKLLFTNKLFKEFVLDNNQKMKVVENFDRAQTVREIKLVYATLAENFGTGSKIKKKSIKESAAGSSKGVGTTKPKKKIISEEAKVANRFKKLAGLI